MWITGRSYVMSPFQHMQLGAFVGNGFNHPARRSNFSRVALAGGFVVASAMMLILYNIAQVSYHAVDGTAEIRTSAAKIHEDLDRLNQAIADADRKLSGEVAKLDGVLARVEAVSALQSSSVGDRRTEMAHPDQTDLIVHRSSGTRRTPVLSPSPDKRSSRKVESEKVRRADAQVLHGHAMKRED